MSNYSKYDKSYNNYYCKQNNHRCYRNKKNNKKGENIVNETKNSQSVNENTAKINREIIDAFCEEQSFNFEPVDMSNLKSELNDVVEKPFQEEYALEEPMLIKKEKKEEKAKLSKFNHDLRPRFVYFLGPLLLIIIILGTTYAWFNYYKEDSRQADIQAGEVYVTLKENPTPTLTLSKAYPRTNEEARARTDNYVDFTILGKNTSEVNSIMYGINIISNDVENGKIAIKPEYLVFDLYELDSENNEKLLVDAICFDSLNNTRIWFDTIDKGTISEISTKYRLRVWLSDQVIISDTESDFTYTSEQFNKLAANISVSVESDIKDGKYPLTFDLESTFNNFSLALSNNSENDDTSDTIEIKISSIDPGIKFNYSYTNIILAQSENDEDREENIFNTNQSSVDIILENVSNETRNISLTVKNAASSGSNIIFEVIKNGATIQKIIKTVYKSSNDKNIMSVFPTTINNSNLKSTLTSISFINVSRATLNSEYSLENEDVYDITLVEDEEKFGDVRAKLSGTTLTVASDGKTYLSTGEELFSEYVNLTNIDFQNVDTSLVNNMSGMFRGSNKIVRLDLSNFDTSNVISMRRMFSSGDENTTNILSYLNIEGFNTSKVTLMDSMFYGCSEIEEIDVSNFDTSKVTQMQQMFQGCSKLITLDVSKFNTENVKYMSFMFCDCSKLTTIDVSKFNTGRVVTMRAMFKNCGELTALNVSKFSTEKVKSMRDMFYGCGLLTTIDVSKFKVERLESMFQMFYGCNAVTELNLSNWKTSNLNTMFYSFRDCRALTSLDLSGFDTSKVVSMRGTFYGCGNLTTIYVSDLWSLNSISDSTYMFHACTSLEGEKGTHYSSAYRDATYARVDNPEDYAPGYFTKKV